MKFKVSGHRLFVKPDPLEEVSAGGIVIAKPGDLKRREMMASQTGVVLQVGPTAWHSYDYSSLSWEPWAKVGDRIYFVKYAGKHIVDEETKEEYFVINDEDVLGVMQ